ncbi:26S proteasome non-ATPase regulatory subunit 1 [Blattella germanica]|nr:26S proteasome non-ATPase regulatory subunit 1 [Blattella germanica]
MNITSAAGIIALLEEPMPELKIFALRKLDLIVDEFWPEISEAIEKIEVLHEDKGFNQHELAALVASKVYYHLAKCIDFYTQQRVLKADNSVFAKEIDPRLEMIVNKMFQRCLEDRQYKQALGLALETRRMDIFERSIIESDNINCMLSYAFKVTMSLIQNRGFRNMVLRSLVGLYRNLATPDYVNMCQCLIFLDDPLAVAKVLERLSLESEQRVEKLSSILSGEVSIDLHLQFLIRSNHSDMMILKTTKEAIRVSICHTATVIANAFMHSGTTSDQFLRMATEDFMIIRTISSSKEFGSLYLCLQFTKKLVIVPLEHKKISVTLIDFLLYFFYEIRATLQLMQSYLPKEVGPSSGYSEGGGLYALGLIHANHGAVITDYLLGQLKDAQNEMVRHGGCLGLGLAAMGTNRQDVYEQLKFNLYQDDAVTGEAAGIAMGMVMLGSKASEAIQDMVAYAQETQHEKILRGLAVGIALTMYGRLEEADPLITSLCQDKDPILRRSGMYTIAMAYCGTGNNQAIRRLLHVAVSVCIFIYIHFSYVMLGLGFKILR